MPKFIGQTIPGSRDLDDAPEGAQLVKLAYSQAVILPATEIYRVLDTSDRGSRTSLAKRWYRWYATVEAIESCTRSTKAMLAASRMRRTVRLSVLIENLRLVTVRLSDDYEKRMRPLRQLGRCLLEAAVAAHLADRGLLDAAVEAGGLPISNEQIAVESVLADAVEQCGAPRGLAHIIARVGNVVRTGRGRIDWVGWRS